MTSDPQRPDLTNAMLAGLAIEADKLTAAASDLRDTYKFSRQLKFITAGFVVVLAGLVVLTAINLSNGRAIRSCTTPGGACYERGQQQTGKAVRDIVTAITTHTDIVVIAVVECSRRPDAQFLACLRSKGIR